MKLCVFAGAYFADQGVTYINVCGLTVKGRREVPTFLSIFIGYLIANLANLKAFQSETVHMHLMRPEGKQRLH
eukprot:1149198-Pelagomonas_calceolata.AAC.2